MKSVSLSLPRRQGLLSEPSYVSNSFGAETTANAATSSDLVFICEQVLRTKQHSQEPLSQQSLDDLFFALVKEWKEDTLFLSSITQMCVHPAYQQIIGMGADVLPFILGELEREPDHWFWALKAITGADPVLPGNIGILEAMAGDWLAWARKQGIRW